MTDSIHENYESLQRVFTACMEQASVGKGRERHANGLPFEKQRMQQISTLLDSDAGMAFQAIKKLTEGLQMKDPAARERELLGAINYIAGIVVWHQEKSNAEAVNRPEWAKVIVLSRVNGKLYYLSGTESHFSHKYAPRDNPSVPGLDRWNSPEEFHERYRVVRRVT